jgi:2,4-dienoyl-CoA reductase-like NADH-dependent reductase (Old Yellow Enzyme family)
LGPSGVHLDGTKTDNPMTMDDINAVINAYGTSAKIAREIGFDGIEIHAAHGYLIDQFFWEHTNWRNDRFGGDLAGRTHFAAEVIRECRRQVGPDYPICLRFSHWKLRNYDASLVENPDELGRFWLH